MNFPWSKNQEDSTVKYYASEVALDGGANFENLSEEEIWQLSQSSIQTPYGTLKIEDVIFVNQNGMVGVQLSVSGRFKFDTFSCSTGCEPTVDLGTVAIMRQPYNVWLWMYMFDKNNCPVANICGHDDLDGFSKFVSSLKRRFK